MSRTVTLNIGLEVGQTGTFNSVAATAFAIERMGYTIEALRVVESDTEPTIVAQVDPGSWVSLAQAYRLSQALGQQAIVVLLEDGEDRAGHVVGPGSEAWGDFRPDLFFGLDGRRLTERAAAAA